MTASKSARRATAPTASSAAVPTAAPVAAAPAATPVPAPAAAPEQQPELELKRLTPVVGAAASAAALAGRLYVSSKAYVPERLQGTVAAAEGKVAELVSLLVCWHASFIRKQQALGSPCCAAWAAEEAGRPPYCTLLALVCPAHAERALLPFRFLILPSSFLPHRQATPYLPTLLDKGTSALQAVDQKARLQGGSWCRCCMRLSVPGSGLLCNSCLFCYLLEQFVFVLLFVCVLCFLVVKLLVSVLSHEYTNACLNRRWTAPSWSAWTIFTPAFIHVNE